MKGELTQTRTLWLALTVLALTACSSAEPGAFPQEPAANPTVSQVTARLALPLSGRGGTLTPAERARAVAFIDAYRDGGRGPLLAVLTAPSSSSAGQVGAALREVAVKRGLTPDALVISSAIGGEAGVTLLYSDFVAKPPGCKPEIVFNFNPTQALSPNYGCSIANNLAAMIAHPADLLGPALESAADGARVGRTIDLYRQGKATQADVNRNDTNQLSSVGSAGK